MSKRGRFFPAAMGAALLLLSSLTSAAPRTFVPDYTFSGSSLVYMSSVSSADHCVASYAGIHYDDLESVVFKLVLTGVYLFVGLFALRQLFGLPSSGRMTTQRLFICFIVA